MTTKSGSKPTAAEIDAELLAASEALSRELAALLNAVRDARHKVERVETASAAKEGLVAATTEKLARLEAEVKGAEGLLASRDRYVAHLKGEPVSPGTE
jgi:hypothetical protein